MDADQIKRVYNRAYEVAFAENPSGFAKQDCILAGVLAVAEWARKQTLEELADDLAAAHSPGWSYARGPIVYTDYDAGTTAGFDEWLRARALGTPQTQEETL